MTDTDYITRLKQQLVNYKTSVLRLQESGFWGKPPRPYPHILPAGKHKLNIVAAFRDAFWREQQNRGWHLHKYFHHMSSSQALAFNLLFLLYPELPLRMVATRRTLGIPTDLLCHLDFEVVLDAHEGTNIDALITTPPAGTRTIIEIKLTESGFGTAKADERHLAKLANIYRPSLDGRIADSCFEPTAFFRDYQLYRNLAQVRRESDDRVVLLLPRARSQLWKHAQSWCASPTLALLGPRISVVALEDVLTSLAVDSAGRDRDSQVIDELSQKYVLRPTDGKQLTVVPRL